MSASPSVSVLLPVRDAEPYLEECLESLATQTWRDFEVIAVDDGSKDGSGPCLDRWASQDERIRVLHLPKCGLVEALNTGLECCRGELVARQDADDRSHPARLEIQVTALREDTSLDVVSCMVEHFPAESVGAGFRLYEEWLNSVVEHDEIVRERFIESPIPHPTVLLRREVLLEAGGYRDHDWPEDYELWLRLIDAGKRLTKIPRTLYFWREHPKRLTRTDSRYAVERFLACKAHHLARGPLVGRKAIILWGAGQTGRRLSKHLLRLDVPLVAFVDIDPRKLGGTLRGLPIHPPEDLTRLRCS